MLIKGKNMGATESFLSLIELAPDRDYYAFEDQDNVWDKNKLEIAVNKLYCTLLKFTVKKRNY